VGMKQPVLFTRKLRPMLRPFHIYRCQLEWAVSEQGQTWSIGLSGQGEAIIKRAAEWHRMPHRRRVLQDLIPWLLQDQATREFLAQRRAAWTEQFAHVKEKRHELDMFLARFDLGNYKQTTEAEETFLELQLPAEIEDQLSIAREESELKSL